MFSYLNSFNTIIENKRIYLYVRMALFVSMIDSNIILKLVYLLAISVKKDLPA